MDLEAITQDMSRRIIEGKEWLESGVDHIHTGYECRSMPVTVELIRFLESPERVEKNGLGFKVCIHGPKREQSIELHMRVKPHTIQGNKEASPPYVVVYVIDQVSGTESGNSIITEHITETENYRSLAELILRSGI